MNIVDLNLNKDQLSFADIINLARMQKLSVGELLHLAEVRSTKGLGAEAAELYKVWIAYNENNPLLHLVYFNYSVTLRQQGDIAGSIHALRACLKIDPKFGQAHINLGRAFEDSGLNVQAIQQWRAYVELTQEITPDRLSHRLMALQHVGRVMEGASLYEDAENALWQAIQLRPDKLESGQHWASIRQHQCKWPTLTPNEHVSMRQLVDAMSPLTLGCYADDPVFQLAKAHRYLKSLVGRPDTNEVKTKAPRKKVGTGQRLRIGYLSSDLRDHAVGFALREVLELHDQSNVEIYAYYIGDAKINDATQERIKAVAAVWREFAGVSDVDAAKQIVEDEVDILIDVNGFTKHARTRILAYRPAPVIVNFCGYPGTMASPFHQYMIADNHIVPPENEVYYTEKVFRIACNQPIDRKRVIDKAPSRAEAGLPEKAFVFACFNGMQKITESTFKQWMRILKDAPGSVLWFLTGGDAVDEHLRKLAEEEGVEPDRLIPAPKAPNAKHLARISVADLFLDTFPYGAHSTAADAITMGLPVLTLPGQSFPSRFCHSIVHAAGIPEMICKDPEDYVAKAIGFAKNPASLKKVRDSLAKQREKSVLRDIPGLAKRLEEIYWEMQGECESGELPSPDFANLDAYYEAGAALVESNIEPCDRETYIQRYMDKLAELDEFSPIPYDNRLWTEASAAAARNRRQQG